MNEKMRETLEQIEKLPKEVQDKILDQIRGAIMMMEVQNKAS